MKYPDYSQADLERRMNERVNGGKWITAVTMEHGKFLYTPIKVAPGAKTIRNETHTARMVDAIATLGIDNTLQFLINYTTTQEAFYNGQSDREITEYWRNITLQLEKTKEILEKL